MESLFSRARRTAGLTATGKRLRLLAGFLLVLALPACGSTVTQTQPKPVAPPSPPPPTASLQPLPTLAKPSRSGDSYVVKGRRYHLLTTAKGFKEEGLGAFYSNKFQGQRTSSGEKYDIDKFTAAHKTLPLGSEVEVRNLENNKTVIVRINDRGPFSDDHVIDVSRAAARQLGMRQTTRVSVRGVR